MQGIYLMLMRFIYSEEICGELRCHYRNLLQLLAAVLARLGRTRCPLRPRLLSWTRRSGDLVDASQCGRECPNASRTTIKLRRHRWRMVRASGRNPYVNHDG